MRVSVFQGKISGMKDMNNNSVAEAKDVLDRCIEFVREKLNGMEMYTFMLVCLKTTLRAAYIGEEHYFYGVNFATGIKLPEFCSFEVDTDNAELDSIIRAEADRTVEIILEKLDGMRCTASCSTALWNYVAALVYNRITDGIDFGLFCGMKSGGKFKVSACLSDNPDFLFYNGNVSFSYHDGALDNFGGICGDVLSLIADNHQKCKDLVEMYSNLAMELDAAWYISPTECTLILKGNDWQINDIHPVMVSAGHGLNLAQMSKYLLLVREAALAEIGNIICS